MSTVSERIDQIKKEQVGQSGKRVLLVEGSDDVDAYRIFLSKKFSNWEQRWAVADMGNKRRVVEALAQEPNWLGLVDRDEWDAEVQSQYRAQQANLLVLPRFCLESFLVSPSELWRAFPDKQRNKVAGGEQAFRLALLASLHQWVRHAALWHGVRPLWQQLRSAGFPDDVTKKPPSPSDQELRAYFVKWHGLLDADELLNRVHALEQQLGAVDEDVFCSQWLHAKHFYPAVVHTALNSLLGVKSPRDRRLALFKTLQVPSDLNGVWQAMGLIP
jgi:hypothetical protein